jgi:hypothetical protein
MAAAKYPLPTEYIDEHLELCPGGVLKWKKPPHPIIPIGKAAGRDTGNGYWAVTLKKRSYGYHRVVYYLAYGKDTLGYEVDHINRNPSDNRPENLRLATTSENKWNTTKRNKTNVQHRGIRKRFWGLNHTFEVSFRGKYVGNFPTLEKAIEAWETRARNHAQEFFCPPLDS